MSTQISFWPATDTVFLVGPGIVDFTYYGQSFTTVAGFSCTGIAIRPYRVGTPGTLHADIYATDVNGFPTGASLATGTIDADTFTDVVGGPWVEQDITFVTPCALSAATKYCLVLNLPDAIPNAEWVGLRGQGSSSGYSGGSAFRSNDGATWTNLTNSDLSFKVFGTSGAEKPTTPSPANDSGPGIDFSDWTFGWVDGGGADSFNVYAGVSSGSLNFVANTASTSYQIPEGNIFRTTLLGGVIYWRVDAIVGEDVATGDEWNFDPRPGKASNPAPSDTATDQRLNAVLSWDAGDYASTYTVYLSGYLAPISVEQAGLTCIPPVPFDYSSAYTWHVDSVNEFGTTTGDEWTFDTIALERVWTTARYRADRTLVPDGTTFDPNTMYYTGDNFTVGGIGRLLSISETGLWYEEI